MIKAQNYSVDQSMFLAERRRHLRLRVPLQVEIRPAGIDVPMRLETADVSPGGCYVEMTLTLDVGTKLEMVIWLGEHKMCAKGVVVTRHPQFGNGIQFVGLSSENERRLQCFLDSHGKSGSVLPI